MLATSAFTPYTKGMKTNRTYTGYYLGIMNEDHLWIADMKTGEIIRQAPAALRDEAEWEAQNRMEEAA